MSKLSTITTIRARLGHLGPILTFAIAVVMTSTALADSREPVSGLHVDLRDLVTYKNHPYVKLAKILYTDLVNRPKQLDLKAEDPNYFLYVVSYDPDGPHGDSFYRVPLSPAQKLNLPKELQSQTVLQNELSSLPDEVPSDLAKDLIMIGKPIDPEKPRVAYIHERSNSSRSSRIFSAQIETEPTVDENNEDLLHVQILMFVCLKNDFSSSFFQRFNVGVDMKLRRVVSIEELGGEINVRKTNFEFKVDLFGRKLIAQDEKNEITTVYPLGVGGLDNGVLTAPEIVDNQPVPNRRLMTPTMDTGYLVKASAQTMLEHCYPDYFNCRPFLPILDNKNPREGWTKLGLHGPITKNLLRGYVSHGCMRMREKDLYEVTAILLGSAHAWLPISIELQSNNDDIDHPMPLYDERYFTVVNIGTDMAPKVKLDEEGLPLTRAVRGPIDFEGIEPWDRRAPGTESPRIKKKPHHAMRPLTSTPPLDSAQSKK